MLSLIRRLFRRCPPHLVGRIPFDAGVGVTRGDYRVGHGPSIRPEVLGVTYDHGPSIRQYEQAPALASGARPDWAVRAAQQAPPPSAEVRRAIDAANQQSAVVYVATGLVCPRPSPIINAQRYSKPDWTW